MSKIYTQEGFRGVFLPGLGATLIREALYSSLRMGLYVPVRNFLSPASGGEPSFGVKLLAGSLTGAIGSALAHPADLVKVRMQVNAGVVRDGKFVTGICVGTAPRYTSSLQAFSLCLKQDGLLGMSSEQPLSLLTCR